VDRRSCTIQRRRTSEVEGSMPWCNVNNMFQDMRVMLLRSTEDVINSLIPPEDRNYVGIVIR